MPAISLETIEPGSPDLAACRTLLRGGSRSFHAASMLLPSRIRRAATALYAFCRLADDAVDQDGADAASLAALERRLDLAYQGRPLPIAADRAFAETVAEYRIPMALPAALLEGFAWDLNARRYRDLEALEAYAARVAGSVGAMLAVVMGSCEPWMLAGACDLGIAMQLTNIARDVGEDAAAGRLYLPLDWLGEAGIDAGRWLANPTFSPALGSVVHRLLEAAETHYRRADRAIAALPASCRPGIRAARLLYAEIGREVGRAGFDSVSSRAVVSARRKLLVVPGAIFNGRMDAVPVFPEAARFLIDAVAATRGPSRSNGPGQAGQIPWWDIDARIAWVIDLFTRLERQEQRL